jgi:hypothetical protein
MAAPKNIPSILLTILSWSILGSFVGLGGSYFVYVKKPAVFESVATVSIMRQPIPESEDGVGGSIVEPETSEGGARGIQVNSNALVAEESIDDGILIVSDAVLTRAVQDGRLGNLTELRGAGGIRDQQTTQVAKRLAENGKLVVRKLPSTSLGSVYEISYRGALPSSSEQVLVAIVQAASKELDRGDSSGDWKEAIKLLTGARRDLQSRIEELQAEARAIDVPDDAVLKNGDVVSAAVEQWQRLRTEAYSLQGERSALDRRLRQAQSLIATGASAESILSNLGQPMRTETTSVANANIQTRIERQVMEESRRREILRQRAAIQDAVDREVAPLQRELDTMLQKWGPKHPTVVFVKSQIAKARAKLQEMPEIEQTPNQGDRRDVGPAGGKNESRPEDVTDGKTGGQRVNALLRSVRDQRDRVASQLVSVSAKLDEAATLVAKEEKSLVRQDSLRKELARQEALLQQTIERVDAFSIASPYPDIEFSVLKMPDPGRKIEPVLVVHLAVGGSAGALAGGVLACLVMLTSIAAQGSEDSWE